MDKGCATKYVLLLTLVTVTSAQYYDFFQGFQQFLQPYQPLDLSYNRRTNTQKNKHEPKTDDDNNKLDKIKNQFDYIFATTPKPSKTTRPHSSRNNNRNKNNNSNIHTESTTKHNKIQKTTTISNRFTTENTFNHYNQPTTENVFQNKRKDNYENQQHKGNLNSKITSDNRGYDNNFNQQASLNNNFKQFPTNNRNPNVQNIKPPSNFGTNYENSFDISDPTYTNSRRYDQEHSSSKPQSYFGGNPDTNTFNAGNFNQGPDTSNNRGYPNYDNTDLGYTNTGSRGNHDNSNNRGNSDYGYTNTGSRDNYDQNRGNKGNSYQNSRGNRGTTHNPLINRPGVRPAIVDNNAPPITNSPVTGNYWGNDRITERPRVTSRTRTTESPDVMPEILLGPDEDDMSPAQKRRYIEMGERLCDRYKSLTVRKVVALPLVPSPAPVEVNVSSCTPINVPLVIGGKVVSINEFPHMALVGWIKSRAPGYSWKCGGSLISDQYVLTAGHCTYQDKDYDTISGPPQAVQLGSSYLDDPGAIVMRVNAVIRHPKYKQRRSYYDVALIKMADKVTFSEVIRPACLGVPPRVGERIIATGWGRTEFGGDHSRELRSVSLPVWDLNECQEIWGTSLKLPQGVTSESHMCAGDERGGKDTCQGDSGGPAQVQDGCVWRITGVTSLGRACAAPRTPALYATLHRPFIVAAILE